MKIDINEKYCITSNANSMMISTRSIPPKFDEKGEEILLSTIAYLPTLATCYKFLLRHQIRLSKATGFVELMQEVERIEKELDASIRI